MAFALNGLARYPFVLWERMRTRLRLENGFMMSDGTDGAMRRVRQPRLVVRYRNQLLITIPRLEDLSPLCSAVVNSLSIAM